MDKPDIILQIEKSNNITIDANRYVVNIDRQVVTLNLSQIALSNFAFLKELSNLRDLNLEETTMSDLHLLDNMESLMFLRLSKNPITNFTPLEKHKALFSLYIEDINIQGFDPFSTLTSLRQLSISGTNCRDISFLAPLTNILMLDMSYNHIEDLTPLSNLTQLQHLFANNNEIFDLRPLQHLQSLKSISFAYNTLLSDISPLKGLKKLDWLLFANNQISDITPLKSLKNITYLTLRKNKLTDISVLSGFKKLNELRISENKITDISPLLKLSNLKIVDLDGNPITNTIPKEVLSSGWEKIKYWYEQEEVEIPLNEIKVLLLGNAEVGKSYLLNYLATKEIAKKRSTTHGIAYREVNDLIPHTCLHFWDFGGQEYFHATHKLFFSPGSLHLVIWENTIRKHGFEKEYWLRCIEQLLAQKTEEPIECILIENKIDKFGNDILYTNVQPIDQISLAEKFPNLLINNTAISIIHKKRLAGLIELITERVGVLNKGHKKIYIDLKNFLKEINAPVISIKDIAQKNTSFKIDDIQNIAPVLHRIGTVLFFEEIALLKDRIFIKPILLLELLYKKVLGDPSKSQLKKKEIISLIKNNKLGLRTNEVLNLLEHFDLVFQIDQLDDIYFIPQYLPIKPAWLDFFENYHFQKPNIKIESDNYLMNLVMLKVFKKYGNFVKRERQQDSTPDYMFWKDGIVIEKDAQLLMLKFDRGHQTIELFPDLHNENIQLQKEVISYITTITNSNQAEKVPAQVNIELDTKLLELEKMNKKKFQWDNDHFDIYVSLDGKFFTSWKKMNEKLLIKEYMVSAYAKINNKGIYTTVPIFNYNKFFPNKLSSMKKVFISYSKQDLLLVNKFLDHLSALKHDGKVGSWYCTELEAGTNWNHEIQEHFDQADIVCFMVSPNFMKTEYIREHEIKKAFEKKEKNPNFIIVPIILDFCRWQTEAYNLAQFTALPYTAKPIVDFPNQNMAWYIVEECLRTIIEKDIQPTDANWAKNNLPTDVKKIFERIVLGEVNAS